MTVSQENPFRKLAIIKVMRGDTRRNIVVFGECGTGSAGGGRRGTVDAYVNCQAKTFGPTRVAELNV